MNTFKAFHLVLLVLMLSACSSTPEQRGCVPGGTGMQQCPPEGAVDDAKVNADYKLRTWRTPSELKERDFDPVKFGEEATVPVNDARAKIIGPLYEEAVTSLAAKIWLIENAQHTIDATYYIFHTDHVGNAMLGAMCNAVMRGVDVRIMVDSLGSFSAEHKWLRALASCEEEAGFMRNDKGQVTNKRARVQAVVFNSFSKLNFNRRSHDKLLVIDGAYADKAVVMTGGRNISLDYYGIKEDGTRDPTAFRDVEILLRAGLNQGEDTMTVGDVSERYFTIVFLYDQNKYIYPREGDEFSDGKYEDRYISERKKFQESLAFIKSVPDVKRIMGDMPRYMKEGFHETDVRLAHQLSNITNPDVTTKAVENVERNPNSIMYLFEKLKAQRLEEGIKGDLTLRIVSPYIFAGVYKNDEGEVIYDTVAEVHKMLRENPGLRLEILTNSVLTSDNFFTQAVIDMEMAPRLLLTPEMREIWLDDVEEGEFNPEFVESEAWKKMIDHPQIFIYETGGLDSILLGGETYYGKLHAKYILGEQYGFVGTSNFDYRSNLYNNEMGFYYQSDGVRDELLEVFEFLKSTSYRWGTPEWLDMRRKTMEGDSKKASPARKQRGIFKTIENLNLKNLM